MKYAKLISTNQIMMAEESGRPEDQLLNCMLSSGYEESDIQIVSMPDAEYDALIVAQDEAAMTYAKKRERDYPTIGDQLDKIYHEGIDAWKTDMIKPIKDKYLKE